MAKKKGQKRRGDQPKVRIAAPKNRPLQIRYFCPKEGREIRVSVGSRDMEDAERLKKEIEAKFLLGIEVRSEKKLVLGPEMEWEQFREQYTTQHLSALRDKTAEDAESRLDIATRIIKPKTLGAMAEPSNLQRLQSRLLAGAESMRCKPRSSHTVRGYMKSIVSALNWAYYQDWLVHAPKTPRIKVSKRKAMKGRPITEVEFAAMLEATSTVVGDEATESWKRFLHGLWESALRIEELMNVSWDGAGAIVPQWTDGEFPILRIPAGMQKNDTDEDIPLLPGFEKLLLETPENQRTGWIFEPASLQIQYGGKPQHPRLESGWVGKVISKIGKTAKIEVSPEDTKTGLPAKFASAHDLRRSCGQRLRNAGVPPLVICRIMRHSSWETTRRHYAPGDIQREAEILKRTLMGDETPKPDATDNDVDSGG
ncbi:tyrosine-type recombinase/integrase [Rosistilla oblonga]|uniref:tyrosine-type recombinase/integrase n=1 Tax=Rosistilla oblonga TaxID=2527990 RepID=UPI003A96DEB8